MALSDSIYRYKKNKKKAKWEILKEHEDDIKEMIKIGMSIRKQIDLILENEILEKLNAKEYRDILIKHFDYKVKSRSVQKIEEKEDSKTKTIATKTNPATSAKDILSQDINLLG